MPPSDFWARLRRARPFRVLIFYAGASWIVLQVVDVVQSTLLLPEWIAPVSFLLLLVGLVVTVATAIVQGDPETDVKEDAGEVPRPWQIAPKQLGESIKAGRLPHLTWGRSLLGGLIAFWFLFGLAGLYVLITDRGESFTPVAAIAEEAGVGIAVLPFQVQGTDDLLLWREGMVDIFSTNLDGVGGFRTIDSRTVLARWGERVDEGSDPDLPAILAVADAAGARFALVGSAVGLGSSVRLSADVYEVSTGLEVGQALAEGPIDDVLELTNELSVGVMQALLAGVGTDLPPVQHTASLTTTSLPALRAYLESEAHYRASDFNRAVEALERAVQADPEFALAYYRLSDAYGWIESISSEQGGQYMRRARELADRLPPRYLSLLNGAVALLEGDLTAVPDMEEAVNRYPDDPEMWFLLGELYYHYPGELMKSLDESDRVFSRAVALDPTFAPYYLHLIEVAIKKRDKERAGELLERYRAMAYEPDTRAYLDLSHDLMFGDSATVEAARAAMDTMPMARLSGADTQMGVIGLGAENVLRLSNALYDQAPGSTTQGFVHAALLLSGRVTESVAALDSDGFNAQDRAFATFLTQLLAGSVPDDVMERNLRPNACEPVHPQADCHWAVAVYAADQGRWDDFETLIQGNSQLVDSLMAEGDSAHARGHANRGVSLIAYRALVEGRPDEAVELLESVQGQGTGGDEAVRHLLGSIHEEEGRLEQAVRYYESFWEDRNRWYYALRLGDLYTELGDSEKARASYALFLEDWANADADRPELARALSALDRGS